MKKNKKRINTSKVVIIFSLILIVVIVLYTSLNSGIFNSDNIEIEGNKYVESEYIIKALEVNNNKNIFRYNIKDMEEILLNNKYIKNSDSSNSEIKKEVKSIKLSGSTNILIGLVGIICSIVALLCGGITKIIIAIFVLCIAILSIFQYIFNKKARI